MRRRWGPHLISGWSQWEPKGTLQCRRLHMGPEFSVWYGRGKKVPWFISHVILSFEFAWLFWAGQFTWQYRKNGWDDILGSERK